MIAIIPARAGSKSIPGKNRRPLAGRPLVGWTIAAAQESRHIDRVVVTTDDHLVIEIAERMGADVHHRSAASATDSAPTEAVLLEVLDANPADHYVLLQATSPLTTAGEIDGAIELFRAGEYDSVLSVVPQTRFVWIRDGDVARPWNYDPRQRPRRQDCEPVLVENGAIYVASTAILHRDGSRLGGRIGLYELGSDAYHELDDPHDWSIVEQLLAARATRGRRS